MVSVQERIPRIVHRPGEIQLERVLNMLPFLPLENCYCLQIRKSVAI